MHLANHCTGTNSPTRLGLREGSRHPGPRGARAAQPPRHKTLFSAFGAGQTEALRHREVSRKHYHTGTARKVEQQHLREKPQVCVAGKLFPAASLGLLASATVAALGQSLRKLPPSGADEERAGASLLARPSARPRSPLGSKSKAGNATRVRRGNRTANLATSSAPPWGFGIEKKASRPSQSTTAVTTCPFVSVRWPPMQK